MNELVKVVFPLDSTAWHGFDSERMWAQETAGGHYRLKNSPFYAMGYSLDDVVRVERDEDGDLRVCDAVVRGGHSTYRIMLKVNPEDPEFTSRWARLSVLGCSYEGVKGVLLAVDVPGSTNVFDVYKELEEGHDSQVWDFEEGHCGHET